MIDLSQVTEILLGSSVVEQITNSRGDVLWSATPVVLPNYFYVEDISGAANTLSIVKDNRDGGNAPTVEIFYSTDGTNWESMGSTDTTPITATIPANGKWYLKSTNNGLTDGADRGFTMISASGSHNIGGNVMSLIAGDNFENAQPDLQSYFKRLFKNDTALVDASALVLPTTATTACYAETFSGCTSLTTSPVLPVVTLSRYCYYRMFEYCTNLNKVTTYANNISAYNALVNWLNGVAATGDFYNYGGATYESGANGIPTGWTEHRANCNVSISAGSNGSVLVNGVSGDYSQSVAYNTQLTLVATPDSGYVFGSWSDGDTNATRTITVTNDLTLTTSFYLNVNYNVSISAGSNGSVSVNGVSGDYSQSVLNGTQLTLVATPDSGYVFDEWSDGDTNATRTITVTNDLTLTAAFEVYTGVPDYHIQYTTTDNNQLSLSNSVITNHTFTNGVGDITINTTTLPAKFFENKTTLRTLAYGGNIEFANGGYQHSGCENLESVDLPANMTYIPQRWFRTCRKLSRLDLPVSAMTWNISWPFYYTATQTTEGVLHVYVHNSTTLPTIDYTRYGTPKDSAFYITGNNGGADGTNIENLIRLYVPSSLYNDYIATAPHSTVASCISSY